MPVVARLVGNGLPEAREVLSAAGIALYPDLDEALAEVRKHLEKFVKGECVKGYPTPRPFTLHTSPTPIS